MRNIARILFVLLMALSVSCVPDNSPAEMIEMVGRLCPEHSNSFRSSIFQISRTALTAILLRLIRVRY